MMKIFCLVLSGLGTLASVPVLATTQNHKAHVHGAGKVTIALESDTKAEIELDVPGDSIFGFEHKARSKQDQATQSEAFRKLRARAGEVVKFDSGASCVYTVKDVGIEAEPVGQGAKEPAEEHHGEHSDVNASYEVNCKNSLTGTQVQVGLMKLFPKIHTLSVQVLSPSGQSQKVIKDDTDFISL